MYDTGIGNPALYGIEIDVVEHRAVNVNDVTTSGRHLSAVHWDGYGADHKQVANTSTAQPGLGNDSWHTYGLRWSPTGYEFYFDDTLIWSTTQAVSARPEYMILSSDVRDTGSSGAAHDHRGRGREGVDDDQAARRHGHPGHRDGRCLQRGSPG